jgi:hypothetical protein
MDPVLLIIIILSVICLIGSWIVPIATLLVAQYLNYIYQQKLMDKAEDIGKKAVSAGKKVEKNIKKMIPSDTEKKSMDDLKKEICKTIDAKTANVAKQQKKAVKDGMKEALEDYKKDPDGGGNIISGLLSNLTG